MLNAEKFKITYLKDMQNNCGETWHSTKHGLDPWTGLKNYIFSREKQPPEYRVFRL